MNENELTQIMNKYGSDKGGRDSGHHNYTEYYDKLFLPLRYEKMNVLEIGIGTMDPAIPSSMIGTPGGYTPGASLRGWRDYFENAQIYGCDIDPKILFQDERITTFHLDQTNSLSLKQNILDVNRMYDIIIDDGLHDFPVNWQVLKTIFPKLKENGVYVIEDIVNFDPEIIKDPFLKKIEFQYLEIPNPKNTADNNIFIARQKGKFIPDLLKCKYFLKLHK